MNALMQKIPLYLELIRFHRPIGTLLLLWPTYCALWVAAEGTPDPRLFIIFTLGTFLMRSAGCAINDYADRDVDGHVQRTEQRPLASGALQPREAIVVAALLALCAFALVLFTNPKTIGLSFIAVLLAALYPFMKRYTQLPQFVLGMAFSFGIPMAFAAQQNALPSGLWLLFFGNLLWTVAYDTFYAMVDRDDDLKIGVKSTAILFGRHDRVITASLQLGAWLSWWCYGQYFQLGVGYTLGLLGVAGLFVYQQWLIRQREKSACFQAFLNNNWVGIALFMGILLHDFLR